eukprot:TRINITY_DN11517_c0_g1_i1.p1 TRINITY_DN11517_c0_g1~~TRINITY_DN11517_c0_g1_i1.p1  ORF type:complete len:691 (-),score=95.77 TRINITY_DN11517_c0_g1_i1:190-2262(-)
MIATPSEGGADDLAGHVASTAVSAADVHEEVVADFNIGRELHRQIGAERWCVTRNDLRLLRREVWNAIREKRIQPTEQDAFDLNDQRIGPTIYTVTEQYIKPTTAKAGSMSWALMRHPKGLKCDLFLTHAWQEGVFEFIDKVLWSWPRHCKHAWCCMLANPQNLDISCFIRDPSASPFAVALRSATCMLVVPNGSASIYTRLWCAYEAFLAYKWEKVILTASAPYWTEVESAMSVALLCALMGSLLSLVWKSSVCYVFALGYDLGLYFVVVVSIIISNRAWRRWSNLIGAAWTGHQLGIATRAIAWDRPSLVAVTPNTIVGVYDWRIYVLSFCLACLLFFVIAEADRVRCCAAKVETRNLKAKYTGSIRDATCLSRADELSIRAEIKDCMQDVDDSIHVLLRAGMSTPSLRQAWKLGVDVTGAGRTEFAFVAFTLHYAATTATFGLKWNETETIILNSVIWLLLIAWLALLCFLGPDGRRFAIQVLQKVALFSGMPLTIILNILEQYQMVKWHLMQRYISFTHLIEWSLLVSLSAARIHRVASIYCIGPRLAQLLSARGFRRNAGACGCWPEVYSSCDTPTAANSAPTSVGGLEAAELDHLHGSTSAAADGWLPRLLGRPQTRHDSLVTATSAPSAAADPEADGVQVTESVPAPGSINTTVDGGLPNFLPRFSTGTFSWKSVATSLSAVI